MIKLDFNKTGGLVPAIVQDYQTGEILMLAYMNPDAFNATLSTGKATYYSRSRQTLWVKGETSGNMQLIKEQYDRKISDASSRGLIWYLRNYQFFQQKLDSDPRILMVNYEFLMTVYYLF